MERYIMNLFLLSIKDYQSYKGNMMNNSRIYFFLALLICLTPYFLLCFYIFPSGDDYSYAWVGANSTDFLGTLIGEWLTWNGRYISNVFVLINPITYGYFELYQAIPFLLITLFIGVHSIFVFKFTNASKGLAVIMSLCFLLIYLNIMPHVGEGIYWYTAAVTYFSPLLLFPAHLILLNKLTKNYQHLLLLTLIALQFLLTGFNEVIMIIMTLLHLGIAVWGKNNRTFWILLATQVIFAALVCFAPGNEVRSSFFLSKHDLIHTVLNGSANTLRFSVSLLSTPSLWISILLFLKLKLNLKTHTASMWFWMGLFFAPQFIACAGPVWTTGIIGQHRTPNFALYFQILVIFMFLIFEGKHRITVAFLNLANHLSYLRLSIVMVISLVFSGNGKTAIHDLYSGEAWGFHQENLSREQKLQSFIELRDTTMYLYEHRYKPKSIFIYDITPDPKDWKNEVYTTFYGLKPRHISIRCKP
ncbi:MAG: hypothetical protein ACJA0Q_001191 [Saprospiraceae bacterium]|jgi:hypothetical protein